MLMLSQSWSFLIVSKTVLTLLWPVGVRLQLMKRVAKQDAKSEDYNLIKLNTGLVDQLSSRTYYRLHLLTCKRNCGVPEAFCHRRFELGPRLRRQSNNFRKLIDQKQHLAVFLHIHTGAGFELQAHLLPNIMVWMSDQFISYPNNF